VQDTDEAASHTAFAFSLPRHWVIWPVSDRPKNYVLGSGVKLSAIQPRTARAFSPANAWSARQRTWEAQVAGKLALPPFANTVVASVATR
jgi:hypothetical protein